MLPTELPLQTFLLALTGLVAFTSGEMCSPPTIAIPVVQSQASYGQLVSMAAEYQGSPPLLIRWTRQVFNPDINAFEERPLVTYAPSMGNNSWPDSSGPRTYAAFYRRENNKITYELQIRQASCDSMGIYTGHFISSTDCSVDFNVSLTAPPLAPLLRNTTIRADPGTTVDIMCEANVGYPAGEIWWYYVSADGSTIRRITEGVTANTTSAGDCRQYTTSTLTVTVNNEDQNGKFRCRSMGRHGGRSVMDHFADGRVAINGLEPTTPTYSTSCRGEVCAGENGGINAVPAVSAIVMHVLVLLLVLAVL